MADCATLRTWLASAELALHQLTIGSKVEVMVSGPKSVTWTRANLTSLQAYVDDLRNQVAACDGALRTKRRVVQFIPQ